MCQPLDPLADCSSANRCPLEQENLDAFRRWAHCLPHLGGVPFDWRPIAPETARCGRVAPSSHRGSASPRPRSLTSLVGETEHLPHRATPRQD
jgi:hypothetical protein